MWRGLALVGWFIVACGSDDGSSSAGGGLSGRGNATGGSTAHADAGNPNGIDVQVRRRHGGASREHDAGDGR
jgi:hypothetical protein